jgi:putative phage-type endonuclease
MIVAELEQRTPEWYSMRSGCATGSKVADIMTKLKKGGYGAARANYVLEVAWSRLTGLTMDHYVSPAMLFGMENEPLARAAYEIATDSMVSEVGLALHPRIKFFAASPDGLIGDRGVLECKCPNSSTHLTYLLRGEVPEEYQWQMLAEMACCERDWCDFVSFDPRMPDNLQLFVRRFHRDEARIAEMEAEVELFLTEVEQTLEKLKAVPMIQV